MNDKALEVFFTNPQVQTMNCVEQSNLIDLIENILTSIKEENPHATVSELLSTDE